MFDPCEVQEVLSNLRRRFPEATEADAKTIILDGMRQERDERRYFARDEAQCELELDWMAAQ